MSEAATRLHPASAQQAQQEIVEAFRCFDDWAERYQLLIELGRSLPPLAPEERSDRGRLHGCQARSWLVVHPGQDGRLHFRAASESAIVSGLLALLLRVYSGHTPDEILRIDPWFLKECGLEEHLSPHRQTGIAHILQEIRVQARVALLERAR
ncbi:MAG TPA: SufE family protein [Roseomonas sp.]|nr:SufE family protein [Roseomonas sp.]